MPRPRRKKCFVCKRVIRDQEYVAQVWGHPWYDVTCSKKCAAESDPHWRAELKREQEAAPVTRAT